MRNDAWQEFVEIRDGLDALLAELLAEALGYALQDPLGGFRIGRVMGALGMRLTLPHHHGAGEVLRHGLKAAHDINRRGGYPCGCGKLKACRVDGVDARLLLEALSCDETLGLDDWQMQVALAGLEPGQPPKPARPPADYDRVGLEDAIVHALATDGEQGMTAAELRDVVGDQLDATSSQIGARLRALRTRGVVTDWTFEDGYFERRAWELVQPPAPLR